MKIWKKNLVAGAVLLTVCGGIYANWAYSQAQTVADLTDKEGITLDNEEYTPIDTWLMIPQSLANKTVTITYILKDRQFSRTFPLAVSNDLTAWAPNQFVDYKVTIAPNMIDFDATVEGWTEKEVFIDDATDSE